MNLPVTFATYCSALIVTGYQGADASAPSVYEDGWCR